MIRTFRIYSLQRIEKMSLNKAKSRLADVRLADAAAAGPARLTRKLSDLAGMLHGERIAGPRSRYGHWELTLRGAWPARRATVSPEPPPLVPVEVTIWLRRTSGWLVVFEANRALGDAAVHLIAQALSGDPAAAVPAMLDRLHWDAVVQWLAKSGGKLLGGRFYNTTAAGADLKWIALRQEPGSDTELLKDSLQNAEGIGDLLIETPHLDSADGRITCRLGRSCNMRVYGSEVADGAIDGLLLELEGLWGHIPLVGRP